MVLLKFLFLFNILPFLILLSFLTRCLHKLVERAKNFVCKKKANRKYSSLLAAIFSTSFSELGIGIYNSYNEEGIIFLVCSFFP